MGSLQEAVDRAARESGFSGVVRIERAEEVLAEAAYGLADRSHEITNTPQTRLACASGTKGLTALVVMRLIEQGHLGLGSRARSLLGGDLPLIADDVTIETLLAHRSGIGDYLDEEGDNVDCLLPVSVHRLATTEDYLLILDGHPTAFSADTGFAYNDAGYVVLALVAERATRTPFPDLVRELVCEPAGMRDTGFLRSDELPGNAARGYVARDGLRTNVFHLPVCGSGDGGIYTTAADMGAFWRAFFAGRIVTREHVAAMVHARNQFTGDSYVAPSADWHYGLGFHVHGRSDAVWLEGYDAGVSFVSLHRPTTSTTYTVLANWTDGAWPIIRALRGDFTG